MRAHHAFAPVFDGSSRLLFLGTMPSPQSVRHGFYYSHPQNRFWPLLARLFGEPDVPAPPHARRALAPRHHAALLDVLSERDIDGAADASIRNPVPNDIPWLLAQAPIERILATGRTAFALHERLIFPQTGRHAVCLPSTSPANQARFPFHTLLQTWQDTLFPQNS